MTTLIYNGFTDQVLGEDCNKMGRKDRTEENMVNVAISRELSTENSDAYAKASNTAIHGVVSQ